MTSVVQNAAAQAPRVAALIDGIIQREGGFVDHPNDPGGATNWGITERVARRNGYTGRMIDMPQDLARQIYVRQYIEGPRFDDVYDIAPLVGEEMIDTGVNCGVGVPGKFLQRALNAFNQQARVYPDIVEDGIIGQNTLAMLEAYLDHRGRDDGQRVLVKALDCLQGSRYLDLAQRNDRYESFTYGWFAHRIGNVETH